VVPKPPNRWNYWSVTYETRYEIARLSHQGPRPYNLFNPKVAILVDDMIDTGRTLSLAVRTLHENGAKSIYALISHGLLSEVNMSMLDALPLERLVVRTPRLDLRSFLWWLTHVSGNQLDFTIKAQLPQAGSDRYESHDRGEHPKDSQRREYQSTVR
jgi:hypothetical protein